MLHMGSYSIDNDLGYHFVNRCAETNWSKMTQDFRTVSFRNENHQGLVQI